VAAWTRLRRGPTILRQAGIDDTTSTDRDDGTDRRLADAHGHVIDELIG